jgi:hypothetical protein
MIILLIAITTLVYTLDIIFDLSISSNINEINTEGDIDLTFKYIVGLEFNSFLNFYIPTIDAYFQTNNLTISLTSSFFNSNLEVTELPEDLFGGLSGSGLGKSSSYSLRASNLSTDIENGCDLVSGLGVTLGLMGGFVGILAGILTWTHDPKIRKVVFVVGLLSFLISLGILLYNVFTAPDKFSSWSILGMGLGFLISGVIFIATAFYIESKYHYMKNFENKVGTDKLFDTLAYVDLLGAVGGLFFDLGEECGFLSEDEDNAFSILKATIALIIGIFSVFLAIQALIQLGGKDEETRKNYYNLNRHDKSLVAVFFGIIGIIIGSLLIDLFRKQINE